SFNLFEDCFAFGTGRFTVQVAYNNSHDNTFRRCWARGEGNSTAARDGGPKDVWMAGYGSPSDGVLNNICENCLGTWSGKYLPSQWKITSGVNGGTHSSDHDVGRTTSSIQGGVFIDANAADPTSRDMNERHYGSVHYVLARDYSGNQYQSVGTMVG